MEPDQGWMAVAAIALLAVLGILTWAGLQETGAPPDPRIGAPGGGDGAGASPTLESFAPNSGGCATGEQENAAAVRSAEQVEGGTRFLVAGTVITSNPCYRVDASVERQNGGYRLRVVSSSTGTGVCATCIGSISYTARVVVPGDTLTVVHDGEVVTTLRR